MGFRPEPSIPPKRPRVLVVAAYGFIGAHIATALKSAGYTVVAGVRAGRADPRFPDMPTRDVDLSRDLTPEDWAAALDGIGAVVNCAGILRGTATEFEAVQVTAVVALGQACLRAGVRHLINLSALGQPEDGEFIASKHRGDAALLALALPVSVLRPSLVYSTQGSYGGTSLLRALAAWPVFALPALAQRPCLQPIEVQDLARAVLTVMEHPPAGSEILVLVGPEAIGLDSYLQQWRQWLGWPRARVWTMPLPFMRLASRLGDAMGRGPLGQTMLALLERGNQGRPEDAARLQQRLGWTPRTVAQALAEHPSHVQDRWHARLYLLLPLLRASLVLLWGASCVTGWKTPSATIADLSAGGPLSASAAVGLARATASLDGILALLALYRPWRRGVWVAMALMVLGYTLGMGSLWPALWAEPLGGLWKNVPILISLSLLWATEERR